MASASPLLTEKRRWGRPVKVAHVSLRCVVSQEPGLTKASAPCPLPEMIIIDQGTRIEGAPTPKMRTPATPMMAALAARHIRFGADFRLNQKVLLVRKR